MAEAPTHDAAGVIVVAEPAIHQALVQAGARWRVQPLQSSVAAMWQGLAGGALDKRSRVLIFSDSQHVGQTSDADERQQVASALVAMAKAGAHVFLVEWRPEGREELAAQIRSAAASQGVEAENLVIHRLEAASGRRALLQSMAESLRGVIDFPADVGPNIPLSGMGVPTSGSVSNADGTPEVDLSALSALGSLEGDGTQSSAAPVSAMAAEAPAPSPGAAPSRPTMPPVGASPSIEVVSEEYPPQAAKSLLDQPKRSGQMTITVTSSKGGSGKSTVSILLAATIARASREAGRPLSVCLIDLDTRDGQVASLIGKFMPTALNIRVQPMWDEERIRRNLVVAEGLGIDTLLAPIRPRTADTVGPDFYRTIVRSLQRMYDVVIMDTSVQYLEPLIADVAFEESDEILFVTTLASTAVQGMARALREMTAPVDESGLGVPREKIGIIVNQSVANVGMERDQVLAAGLGVPVVGVIPLATRDVLTATNLNRMHALLDHPMLGPAYQELAGSCLPDATLAAWAPVASLAEPALDASASEPDAGRKRGIFRR